MHRSFQLVNLIVFLKDLSARTCLKNKNVACIYWPKSWYAQSIVLNETRQITYLDLHVIVEEDVSKFQVSVDDSVVVQVMDALQQLCHVVASLGLSHCLPTLVKLQQRLQIKEND